MSHGHTEGRPLSHQPHSPSSSLPPSHHAPLSISSSRPRPLGQDTSSGLSCKNSSSRENPGVSLPAWRPQETAGEGLPWMGDSPQLLHDFLSYKRRGTLGIHALNTALPRSSFCKATPSEGSLGLSSPPRPASAFLIPHAPPCLLQTHVCDILVPARRRGCWAPLAWRAGRAAGFRTAVLTGRLGLLALGRWVQGPGQKLWRECHRLPAAPSLLLAKTPSTRWQFGGSDQSGGPTPAHPTRPLPWASSTASCSPRNSQKQNTSSWLLRVFFPLRKFITYQQLTWSKNWPWFLFYICVQVCECVCGFCNE